MSEPLSTSEIEDVLSSIRRLVSDDLRPAPVMTPVTQAAPRGLGQAPSGDEASKLLLTPALRVVPSDGEEAAETGLRGIDDVLAAVSAGVDQQPEEWEPETGDPSMTADPAVPEAGIWEDAPPIEDYIAPVNFVSSRTRDEEVPAGEIAAEDIAVEDVPVKEVSAEEIAVGEISLGAGSVGGEGLPGAEGEAVSDPVPVAPASSALPGWAQSLGAEEADAPRPDPMAASAEQVVFGTVEPDRVWADAAEAAVLQELQGASPHRPQMAPHGADEFVLRRAGDAADASDAGPSGEGDEVPVDAAMLREIVRDVLREELQGRLGERITRNIRKLVRAEIARVMAAEELL